MKENKKAFKSLTDKPTGRGNSGRIRHRWENNIGMYLKEMAVNTRYSVDSDEDRGNLRVPVNVALNIQGPYAMGIVKKC